MDSPAWKRVDRDETGSTNTDALEAARAGEEGPLWITARRQTEGRGRRGRNWISETGNLYASFLTLDPGPLHEIVKLPLVASVAVADAVTAMLGGPERVSVKWPNDVMISGRKVVGILLESERLASGRVAVVLGCGVNLRHAPKDPGYGTTSLLAEGAAVAVEDAFALLASSVQKAYVSFDGGKGFPRIRDRWLAYAQGLGERCRVNFSDHSIDGVFEAIDPDGRLILRGTDQRRQAIAAGDLFFLRDDARRPA